MLLSTQGSAVSSVVPRVFVLFLKGEERKDNRGGRGRKESNEKTYVRTMDIALIGLQAAESVVTATQFSNP